MTDEGLPGPEERRPVDVEDGEPKPESLSSSPPGSDTDSDDPQGGTDPAAAWESDGDGVSGTRVARAGEAGPDGPTLGGEGATSPST